jgi:hypothetical protein
MRTYCGKLISKHLGAVLARFLHRSQPELTFTPIPEFAGHDEAAVVLSHTLLSAGWGIHHKGTEGTKSREAFLANPLERNTAGRVSRATMQIGRHRPLASVLSPK